MGGAVGRAARHGLAAVDVGLAFEPPRERPEDGPEQRPDARRDRQPLDRVAPGGGAFRVHDRQAGEPRFQAGEGVRGGGEEDDEADEEEQEVGEVAVGDVADLVPEDRGDLGRRQAVDQGVGEEDVAEPGQDPRDAGVHDHAVGVPDQDVRASEPRAPGDLLQAAAERPVRERARRPGQPDEQRRGRQDQRPQHGQLGGLRPGFGPPGGPEAVDHVVAGDEDRDDGEDQRQRLPLLQVQVAQHAAAGVRGRQAQDGPLAVEGPPPGEELHRQEGRDDERVVHEDRPAPSPGVQHDPRPPPAVDDPAVGDERPQGDQP